MFDMGFQVVYKIVEKKIMPSNLDIYHYVNTIPKIKFGYHIHVFPRNVLPKRLGYIPIFLLI